MNKKLVGIFLILFFNSIYNEIYAQNIAIDAQSSYIRVNTFDGHVTQNAYGVRVTTRGVNTFVPNWTITAKLNGEVKNSEGKVFDPSKISLRINNISDDGPTLLQIGTKNQPISLRESEVAIISKSKVPIVTDSTTNMKQFYISFDVLIEAGDYLKALKSWDQYTLDLTFTIKDKDDQPLSQSHSSILMQITPQ